MKLPNLENAQIPPAKITDYLLSFTHRDGRHKAAFFTRFGFSADNWEIMAAACGLVHCSRRIGSMAGNGLPIVKNRKEA
jgi:hypothetical protein